MESSSKFNVFICLFFYLFIYLFIYLFVVDKNRTLAYEI